MQPLGQSKPDVPQQLQPLSHLMHIHSTVCPPSLHPSYTHILLPTHTSSTHTHPPHTRILLEQQGQQQSAHCCSHCCRKPWCGHCKRGIGGAGGIGTRRCGGRCHASFLTHSAVDQGGCGALAGAGKCRVEVGDCDFQNGVEFGQLIPLGQRLQLWCGWGVCGGGVGGLCGCGLCGVVSGIMVGPQ